MYHQCGNVSHKVYHTNIFVNGNDEDPEWQQWKRELQAIASQVPARLAPLKPVVQLLVAALAPAQIYCLNHAAINDEKEAPLHLCLLMPCHCTTPFTELEPVLELAGVNQKKISCSLHHESNAREALNKGHMFYTLAFRKEQRIYDSGAVVLPEPGAEALAAAAGHLERSFGNYHSKASRFYEAACVLLQQQDLLGMFMLQQAAEMILRGMILCLSGYERKTHELRSLKKHLRRSAPQLLNVLPDDTAEEQRLLTLLEDAYLQTRYGKDYACSPEDADLLRQRVATLISTAAHIKAAVLQQLEVSNAACTPA